MRPLEEQLARYASYHRDPRNIATHFIGIPLIVLSASALLSRPAVSVESWPISPAVLVAGSITVFYFRLDARWGALMAFLLGASLWFGARVAALATPMWLGLGIAAFVVGWVFQFVGHAWEGRKPAFVDDLRGLAIGPLFIVAEALFLAGLMPELRRRIDSRADRLRQQSLGVEVRSGLGSR